MAKADVWMPLYIGDYLADTRRLTTEQHGAYLLLLMDYWRNGPPPDDAQTLAQITLLAPDAWSIAQAKLKPFFSIEDGVWRHKRVDEEMASARENRGKAQAKAKAAADARWGKTPKKAAKAASRTASSDAPSMPKEIPEGCPSPSPSPPEVNQADDDSTVGDSATAIPAGFDEGGFAVPRESPLPMREQPPLSEDPAVVLTVRLRRMGVNVMSTNPYLMQWVADGIAFERLAEAITVARENKPEPEKIAPGYLVPILDKLLNPPVGRTPSQARAAPLNEKFHFNHLDRSGDQQAMDEAMKRHGITVPDNDEEIEI